ncbi:hypothetical protein T11_3877 [Trichinella zimbabwensis]|uniref:Reverse transcriptase/retrotransposon-derived protein RNase H-like domain-containing protein n=1 Tax=Trichinella zimbabwensis TaxID=268475 RepID=A0A0V1HKY6_9BILA|nr:hypothetical protein T11_3877 [Trichinella zimbabwensis]
MASSNQHVRASHAPWSCELLPLICEIVCEHSKTPAPYYGTRSWSNEAEEAFQCLEQALSISSVSRFDIPFVLNTDASEAGIGAVLKQKQDPEGERVIVYLRNFKDPESQVARWPEYLKEYDVEVVYRRGRHHDSADAMSGRPEVTMDNLDYLINETPSAAVGTAAHWKHLGLTPAGLAVVVTGMATRSVPPTHAHLSFLEQLHNGIGGGHLHVKKMAEKVKTRYFSPGWYRDVKA